MDYTELLTIPGEAGIFMQPANADELLVAANRAGLACWRVDLADVREKADRSTDGGKTWTPLFDIVFRPHRPS